ncbi:hypothetical protein DSO57_1027048 [Entomophthora muscae]|uniref:Uncharacterized protein n=1 Tax=Entomophthora muscae TaxID=34485 RepID=A0ACC2UMA0_9FUNG|nr:hypothetical protein DSO57_1027048 [Entomophthora muscae]
MKTGCQSQASYQNLSGQEEYHILDTKEETNQRLPCSIQVLEVVTENGGPFMVTIEETVQNLKERHWQAAPAATAPHNTLPFFKPANLLRFDRKNIAMFLWLYQNSMYGADKAMKDTA